MAKESKQSTAAQRHHLLMQMELRNARKILQTIDVIGLPTEILKLQNLLSSTEFPDLIDVESLISQNEVLAGDVIQLANSVLFAGVQPVRTIRDAVQRIGIDKLKNLVLSMTLQNSMLNLGLQDITNHSVEVASVSAELAKHVELISNDEAYLLGLFHNIGALMMAVKYPEYEACFFNSLTAPLSTYHKEERTYQTTHAHLGVLIAEQWGIEMEMKKVMLLHHTDHLEGIKDERVRSLVALIQLANAVVSEMVFGIYVSQELRDISEKACEILMVPKEVLNDIRIGLLSNSL